MTKSHNNYSLRAACPVEISWISNFTKSWFGVFDMQRSWRPKDNAVNNLKPRSRFEENLSLLVNNLPTDKGRSHWMCELVHLPGSAVKGPTQAPISSDQTHTQPLTDTAMKRTNGPASTASIFSQTIGQRIALCQKALPALNPVPNSRTVTKQAKGNGCQHWSNTGDTSSVLPKTMNGFSSSPT